MQLKKLNLLLGWLSFAIALTTYLLTLEPTVSLWDCGEFIASSYKLQVGHPPGAPLFMILGKVFSIFTSDVNQVAKMINAVSAFASAFTIMFLFWTISHLLQKIVIKWEEKISLSGKMIILGGAFTGAMAYTFSDTFWFSAVEGEVYATSSLFTAVVFWAILKWENVAGQPGANRWIILIAYLMGLSIGIHLLNLLAIPAIVLVYYFKNYKVNGWNIFLALLISLAILLFIMYGIIPGIVRFASWFELFFTNTLKLHYNTGLIVYAVLLTAGLFIGIYFTQFRGRSPLWNTIFLCITFILIGYSSYAMIVIRSKAGPPMNENRPENVFSLLSYLNREQYGDRPLIAGYQWDAQITDLEYKKPVFVLDKENNRYEVIHRKPEYVMEGNRVLFPRMYSRDANHVQAYKEFGTVRDGKPTFFDNIEFFLRYQVGHMYLRYFMWNFAGRQNDSQGHGNVLNGNWISGIPIIDSGHIGPQKDLPDKMKKHPSRNRYFFLPLALGLIGVFYQYSRGKKDFWVVLSLFILTGLAIVIYLNQTPYQPRERDYAYAGSFYAFSIWIGLGVAGIASWFYRPGKTATSPMLISLAIFCCLALVPGLMAQQNWDDHDRSGRFLARDIARNYLNSCDRNAILFTVGDNDTFPLWYVQDVEGVREDVRIVNMMLFNMEWYIDQMRMQNYSSPPLNFTILPEKYQPGTNNSIYIRSNEGWAPVDYILKFIQSEDQRTKLPLRNGTKVDYIPTHQMFLPVDSATVVDNGTLAPGEEHSVLPELRFKLEPNSQIMKGALAQLDVLGSNNWERPIYYTSGGFDGSLGLEKNYRAEGLAYRVVPVEYPYQSIIALGGINTDTLYHRLMETFEWGRMNAEDVQLDYYSIRTLNVIRFRSLYTRLALALQEEGKISKAIEVLDKCMELAPKNVLPFDQYVTGITIPDGKGGMHHFPGVIETYYLCGEFDKGNAILKDYYLDLRKEFEYYNTMKPRHSSSIQRDINDVAYQLQEMEFLLRNFEQKDVLLELGISG